jgi:hypothetical protein
VYTNRTHLAGIGRRPRRASPQVRALLWHNRFPPCPSRKESAVACAPPGVSLPNNRAVWGRGRVERPEAGLSEMAATLESKPRPPQLFPCAYKLEVGRTSSLRGFYSDEGNAAAARNRVVAAGASRQTPATSHARGLTDSLLDLRHSPAALSGACRARPLRGLGDTVKGPRLCGPLPHAETPPANRGTFTSTAGVEQAVPNYHYELRRADVVVATGRLNREEPFEVGEAVVIGGHPGIVRAVYPQLVRHAQRVVVQLTVD